MMSYHSIKGHYDIVDVEKQFLSRLIGTVESKQWEVLEDAIINNPQVFQTFARSLANYPPQYFNGVTILHACIRYNPPTSLVKILLDLVPESPTCVDIAQRTPLHVAVGMRANLSTIEALVDACPGACAMLDWEGKTPLHLACDANSCTMFEENNNNNNNNNCSDYHQDHQAGLGKDHDKNEDLASTAALVLGFNEQEPKLFDIVRKLLHACPLAAVVEDQDGMTALEHAILSDASIEVVRLLQTVTCLQTVQVHTYMKTMPSRDESILCNDQAEFNNIDNQYSSDFSDSESPKVNNYYHNGIL